LELPTRRSVAPAIAVDGDADTASTHLYFTTGSLSPSGVHVIEDPAGTDPRYVGRVFETNSIDSAISYDGVTQRLSVYDTLGRGRARPRIVQLE